MKKYIRSNNGKERMFLDTENGDVLTISQLRDEYKELYEAGETESPTFEGYLNNCLGKNGFLEEVYCSAIDGSDEYGVLTQDNFDARLNIVVFETYNKANIWAKKLNESPTERTLRRSLNSAKYLWDDALPNQVDGDKYYTDASGYSDTFITLVNTKPIVIS